jgi:hypothetical protein
MLVQLPVTRSTQVSGPGSGMARSKRLKRTAWARARPANPPPSRTRVPRTPNECSGAGVTIDPVARPARETNSSALTALPAVPGASQPCHQREAGDLDDRFPNQTTTRAR